MGTQRPDELRGAVGRPLPSARPAGSPRRHAPFGPNYSVFLEVLGRGGTIPLDGPLRHTRGPKYFLISGGFKPFIPRSGAARNAPCPNVKLPKDHNNAASKLAGNWRKPRIPGADPRLRLG